MLTVSLTSSELPEGGAAKCLLYHVEQSYVQTYSSEYTILDLVYIPAVITLMWSAS